MLADISVNASSFKALFENTIFLSPLSSLCITQALKGIIYAFSGRNKKPKELLEIVAWRTGGMPSSHSAVVCSLSTAVAFKEGIASNLFIFSFWFALVVLRDAMGVRRSAGLVARALNNLGRQAVEKAGVEFNSVKEIQGHTPLEVIVGSFLGVFIAAGLHLL